MTPQAMATLLSIRRARERNRSAQLAAARAARQQAMEVRETAERAFRSFGVLRRVQEAMILRGLEAGPLPVARVIGAAASLAELQQREMQLRRRATNAWTQQRNTEASIAEALQLWSQAYRRAEACASAQERLARDDECQQERRTECEVDELALQAHARNG